MGIVASLVRPVITFVGGLVVGHVVGMPMVPIGSDQRTKVVDRRLSWHCSTWCITADKWTGYGSDRWKEPVWSPTCVVDLWRSWKLCLICLIFVLNCCVVGLRRRLVGRCYVWFTETKKSDHWGLAVY